MTTQTTKRTVGVAQCKGCFQLKWFHVPETYKAGDPVDGFECAGCHHQNRPAANEVIPALMNVSGGNIPMESWGNN